MINNIDNTGIQTVESQATITPEMAIELLKKGNQRFVANQTIQRDISNASGTNRNRSIPLCCCFGLY